MLPQTEQAPVRLTFIITTLEPGGTELCLTKLVACFLKSASLLLLPPRWEGMPNIVLRAMACGLPVACSRTHGIRELLGEPFDSQVFSSRDTTSLLKCVASILAKLALVRQLGHENRSRAIRNFSTSSMLDCYGQPYREQLKRS